MASAVGFKQRRHLKIFQKTLTNKKQLESMQYVVVLSKWFDEKHKFALLVHFVIHVVCLVQYTSCLVHLAFMMFFRH